MDLEIESTLFSSKDNGKLVLLIIGLVLILLTAIGGYLEGTQDKDIFLIVNLSLAITPLLIILVTIYRFTLINKYPYLVNLPAFFILLQKVPKEKQSTLVNRYYSIVLDIGIFITGLLIFIAFSYSGLLAIESMGLYITVLSILLPAVIIIYLIIRLRTLMNDFNN